MILSQYFWSCELNNRNETGINLTWSYGVMVSTLDSESNNPSSNLGRTFFLSCKYNHPQKQKEIKKALNKSIHLHTLIMLTNWALLINFHPFINTHRMKNMLTFQYLNIFQMLKFAVAYRTYFFLLPIISSLVLTCLNLPDQTRRKRISIRIRSYSNEDVLNFVV